MLHARPVDHETVMEFADPTAFEIGERVQVVRHCFHDGIWKRLGVVVTGEVWTPPSLSPAAEHDSHINVFPDEPYPAEGPYPSLYPVWFPRKPSAIAEQGLLPVCYTVEPLEIDEK